jgi:predicted outer membrane protein
MRTLLSLALAAVFAACSGSHRDEEPDASPIARESAAADLQRSRCALRDPVSANAREMTTSNGAVGANASTRTACASTLRNASSSAACLTNAIFL